jgi:hypothetical protein
VLRPHSVAPSVGSRVRRIVVGSEVERATTASADLIHNVIGDREATFVSATILSHSVSHGLYVLQLWTDSEPSDVLFLKSHDHVIEQQVAAIRSAFDVRDVENVFLR